MIRHGALIAIVVATSLHLSCDRPKPVSTPSPPPATAPATLPTTEPVAQTPTTQPAATQPAFSQLTIDGRPYTFPDARLRVGMAGSHVVARLYTNDPKAALDDDYKGNHYDVQMRLDDIQAPQQVYASVWQFKSQSQEFNNTPYGIFLDGMRFQLQPMDVTARFLGTMLQVQVSLDGQFLLFDDADKSATPKVVYVKGSLLAPVEYKD